MEFTNEVKCVQKEQNVNANNAHNAQNSLIQNLSEIQNSPVQDVHDVQNFNTQNVETMDDLQNMANEIAQEESEELLFEETTTDDIMNEEDLDLDVEKPESNNMMLLALGALLVAFFFRKEIKDFFENLFNKTKKFE
jgi:hypothetical protein